MLLKSMVLKIGEQFSSIKSLQNKLWKELIKMRKNVTERVFKCPVCGSVTIAYKKSSRRTAANHVKTMWCYKCKKVEDFTQVKYY